MKFTLQHNDPASNARAGLIETDHGKIETPIFMPVGTVGSVKAVHQHELKEDVKDGRSSLGIPTIFSCDRALKCYRKPVVCTNLSDGIDPF